MKDNKENRAITTLFTLMSVDGKITLGSSDLLDFDKDLPNIGGDVSKGLYQYYAKEKETDKWCLTSGKTWKKIGINHLIPTNIEKLDVSCVVIDNGYLERNGLIWLSHRFKQVFVATKNLQHLVFYTDLDNVSAIGKSDLSLKYLLEVLKKDYGCDSITVQTGGTLNSELLRYGLLDKLNIIVAPLLIGGKHTSSLIDGYSFENSKDLKKLGFLKLKGVDILKNSYIRLRYDVESPISID